MSHTIQLDMRRATPTIELAVALPVGVVAEVASAHPQSVLSPAASAPIQLDLRRAAPALELAATVPTEVTAEMIAVISGPKGEPGPPGPGTGGGIEQSIYVDASRPIAYVAYADRIVRLDYATWPPVETTASTTDVHTDWPNRATLEYA